MTTASEKYVIMSIDDDPVTLNSLVSILREDYNVRPFTSGKAALAYLAKNTVDLILLDYQMPDMLGIEVLDILHQNPITRDIPTIFLTSSVDSKSEVAALDHGAVDYITKPIRKSRLLVRVKLQLELQKHKKELESLVEKRTRKLHAAYSKLQAREDIALRMLAKATDLRDHDTGGHIERTTEFSRIIIEHILQNPKPGYTFSRDMAQDIIRSARLHDLGKIGLPDNILLKPGKLSNEEFALIKKHSEYGNVFLEEFVLETEDSFLITAKDIAHAHHERWDGSGYPLGLKGEEIPLSARIVAIADVYDALTSVRPYKRSMTHEEAVQIITDGSESHFDPHLVGIFLQYADTFDQIKKNIDLLPSKNTYQDQIPQDS